MNYKHPFLSASRNPTISSMALLRPAVLLTASLVAIPGFAAQSAPQPATQAPAKGSAHPHAKPSPVQAPAPQEQAAPAAPAPDLPHWPADQAPAKPSVTWDSHGLRIDATNASLREILNDVSTATGAKVEGIGEDQRVFGEYGPGQARDVLSQLLHGSGYNVLMIGDQGEGTPREIVLSTRRSGGGSPAANRSTQDSADDDTPEQPEPEDQPVVQPQIINGRPPMPPQGPPQGPDGTPRTPQQILQELQQRQQQMQEQQQQQQPPH